MRASSAYGSALADPGDSPEWVNFFSDNTTFLGEPVPVRAVITAHDPHGVQCGQFTVIEEGKYGLMPCYRDDPDTPDEDEGPLPGEPISFKINGLPATPVPKSLNGTPVPPSTTVTWTEFGDLWEVDLLYFINRRTRQPWPGTGQTMPMCVTGYDRAM